MNGGGTALARKLHLRIWRDSIVANLLAATLLTIIGVQMEPFIGRRSGISWTHIVVRELLVGAVFIIVCAAVSYYVVGRRLSPVRAFLVEEREPTMDERRTTLAQPTKQGVVAFGYWAAILVVAYVLNRRDFVWSFSVDVKIVVAVLGWGTYAAAAMYLLVETTMRPALPFVLHGESRVHAKLESLLTRSLLIGGLGSGWVLVLFLTLIVGSTEQQRSHAEGGAILSLVIAMAASLILTIVSARSVIRPLRGVQHAMRRVADGDLDITVPIDDATEVGQLQAGFNHMLAGLRERERIRDLFGRHIGAQVAEAVLGQSGGMIAETRDASVMFIDVMSSTALAQQRPAQEVLAMLNALFDAVVRTVGNEGGYVNQFQGDGALCIFGAPQEQPDHAERALRAARALREEVDAVARAHPGFNAAIGVSSGEVVAGNIGSESRYEYTVIGDPVNEASRLTDAAKIYSCRLLAARSAIDAARDEAPFWTFAGEFELRGRSQLTLAYAPV